jgi:hypothetical protein
MSIIYNDENFVVYVPQFTVDDDAIVFPFRLVESLDFATLSELIQLNFSPQYDSLNVNENIILSVDLDSFESVSVVDSFLSLEINPEIDTAIVSENIFSTDVSGIKDSITLSDTIAISADASDTGTFFENVAVTLDAFDSGQLQEYVNNIYVQNVFDISELSEISSAIADLSTIDIVDQEYGEFTSFAGVEPPDYDPYYFYDFTFVSAELPAKEDPVLASETNFIIELNNQDLILASDSVQNIFLDGTALTDFLTLSETSSFYANAIASDIFVYQDNFVLDADYNSNDLISYNELFILDVSISRMDIFNISENVQISNVNRDFAALSEQVSIAISTVDVAQLREKPAIGATSVDIAILNEMIQNNAIISKTDSALISEKNLQIDLFAKYVAQLTETALYHADYARLDYLFLISEEAFASILKEDFDSIAFFETKPNIGLNRFELITFKEKTAIGIAQPLIININDIPTVHGTVVGNPIIISLGGTVPTLL